MKGFLTLIAREYWEHKSLRWVPAIVWCIFAAFSIWGAATQTDRFEFGPDIATAQQNYSDAMTAAIMWYFMIVLTYTVLALFYCLGALYAERKDGSILFWKALPLSNTQIVLSKLAAALLTVASSFLALTGMLLITLVAAMLSGLFKGNFSLLWEVIHFGDIGMTLWLALRSVLWFCVIVTPWLSLALFVSVASPITPYITGVITACVAAILMFSVEGFIFLFSPIYMLIRQWASQAEYFGGLQSQDAELITAHPPYSIQILSSPMLYQGLAFAIVLLVLCILVRRFRH